MTLVLIGVGSLDLVLEVKQPPNEVTGSRYIMHVSVFTCIIYIYTYTCIYIYMYISFCINKRTTVYNQEVKCQSSTKCYFFKR